MCLYVLNDNVFYTSVLIYAAPQLGNFHSFGEPFDLMVSHICMDLSTKKAEVCPRAIRLTLILLSRFYSVGYKINKESPTSYSYCNSIDCTLIPMVFVE